MLKLGFKEVYNLNDGISSWISEELSIVKSESELLNKKTNHAVTKLDIENFLINNQFSLLYISTQWCVPCKKLKPIIDDLQSDFKDVNILNIDADINKSEIIDFNVTSVPVIILFKNNIEIFRNIGFISKESLYNQLVIINR
jgi:thioredoxin 1